MSDTPDLFEAYARDTDPDTAHRAAGEINVQRAERIVLDAAKTMPFGATCDQLVHATKGKLPPRSVSPRLKPLREKGLLEWRYEHGEKIVRPGDSGSDMAVHFVTPKAWEK